MPFALTAWIFTGLRPVIPRMTIWSGFSWMYLMPAPRWFSTITINAADVTWEELWDVYRSIRSQANVKRQKLNPLHARICQVVHEKGGPPVEHGQKRKFWESVSAQLRAEKGKDVPGTWEAIRKAYVNATSNIKSTTKGEQNGHMRSTKK